MTISSASLRQDVFETIYDRLTAKAVASSFGTSTQPTITATYIDSAKVFPQIVVNPADVEEGEYVFDRSSSLKNIVVVVETYGLSNQDRDILSDNINTFMESPITGMTLESVDENNSVSLDKDTKIRNKTITFTFSRR
jgi:hypothetical protein|tara:strand:+ start:1756 stop:2169 length:414 start_codon:yes stop_codon:yes gene_type:complete